jgi:peroxiredoxin Q/BCP
LRDGIQELRALNVEVVGISFDSPQANKAFADANSFPFQLLSDQQKEVAIAYGAAASKSTLLPSRQSFILDEHGKLTHIFRKVSPKTHLDEVLAGLKDAQSTAPQ